MPPVDLHLPAHLLLPSKIVHFNFSSPVWHIRLPSHLNLAHPSFILHKNRTFVNNLQKPCFPFAIFCRNSSDDWEFDMNLERQACLYVQIHAKFHIGWTSQLLSGADAKKMPRLNCYLISSIILIYSSIFLKNYLYSYHLFAILIPAAFHTTSKSHASSTMQTQRLTQCLQKLQKQSAFIPSQTRKEPPP